MSKADHPSFGRVTTTVEELFGHLIDMGQYQMAFNVLATSIEAKGPWTDE